MQKNKLQVEMTISLVSHGQGGLVSTVLNDLARFYEATTFEVILTLNISERLTFEPSDFPYPIHVVENRTPKGFGANHNAAFKLARGEWFCVMNPDIALPQNPFPDLFASLAERPAGVVAPAVLSPSGVVEDSVRYFPTLLSLLRKAAGKSDGRYSYVLDGQTFSADWVAGMFMLFRAEDFRRVGGFDEGFFLYYEDVDICTRLWRMERQVVACPKVKVVHDAQRTSRRNLRYMRWHAMSLLRYLIKHWLRLPRTSASK